MDNFSISTVEEVESGFNEFFNDFNKSMLEEKTLKEIFLVFFEAGVSFQKSEEFKLKNIEIEEPHLSSTTHWEKISNDESLELTKEILRMEKNGEI